MNKAKQYFQICNLPERKGRYLCVVLANEYVYQCASIARFINKEAEKYFIDKLVLFNQEPVRVCPDENKEGE